MGLKLLVTVRARHSPLAGFRTFDVHQAQRVLSMYMGDIFPSHSNVSSYRNPTFHYVGT